MSDQTGAGTSVPEVSVVIAAFNAASTLPEQLAALERQDVPFDWEILVCDNGSSDDTADVVRSWGERLPTLRLIAAAERRGPGAARNVGARRALAPFLMFCDADDVVADDWLRELHAAVVAHGFVAGAIRYDRLNAVATGPRDVGHALFTKSFLPVLPASGAGNMAIDAAVFAEVHGFDEEFPIAEDIDLCWRIQLAGHPLVACESAIVQVRRRSGLLALFRQSYSYAVGDRALEKKYADVIAATRQAAPERAVVVAAESGDEGRAGLLSRALRPRGRESLAFLVDRVAQRLARRFGRPSGSIGTVAVHEAPADRRDGRAGDGGS